MHAAPHLSALALEVLIQDSAAPESQRGGALPAALRQRYGGDIAIPLRSGRPTVVANFVTTLDGVVSYNTPEAAGGGEISGFFEPDRFVMGLLRALADVVLIGAGTLRAAPTERWTPAYVHPPSARSFEALRQQLGLAPEPVTGVVTASGEIELAHPGLADPHVPVVVVTTERGRRTLVGRRAQHIDVDAAGLEHVEPIEVLHLLDRRGARLVLCEGGPQLFGQLLRDGLVDELFLTLAPQMAGRSSDTPRLSLVEGSAFSAADARWSELVDLRRSDNHLFARYRMKGRNS